MSLPRRLINVAGTVLVLAILAAGTLLFAGPTYMQSFDVVSQRLATQASNDQLRERISELQAEKAQLPQLEKQLAGLREQIPSTGRLDDVSRLVVDAADAAGVTIVKIDYEPPVPFTPNSVQAAAPLGAPELPPSAGSGDATGDDATDPSASPTPEATPPATGQAQSADPNATPTGNVQFPVVIDVRATSVDKLVTFIDGLRAGPRLLQLDETSAAPDPGIKGTFALKVKAFTYVKTDTTRQER